MSNTQKAQDVQVDIINKSYNADKMIKSDDVTTAKNKLANLLTCGNERVELSAAKEIIALDEKEKNEQSKDTDNDIHLEVVIKII